MKPKSESGCRTKLRSCDRTSTQISGIKSVCNCIPCTRRIGIYFCLFLYLLLYFFIRNRHDLLVYNNLFNAAFPRMRSEEKRQRKADAFWAEHEAKEREWMLEEDPKLKHQAGQTTRANVCPKNMKTNRKYS